MLPVSWQVPTTNRPTESNEWGSGHFAPPMEISWNHLVPVIHALDALIGAVTTFSHIVTGIP